MTLPSFNKFSQPIKVMGACIVHDEDRIPLRIWVHDVKETLDVFLEFFFGPGACDDVEMEHPVKGYSGKDRVSVV